MAMTEPRQAVGYYFLNDHDTLPPQLKDERAMAHFSTYLDNCSFRRFCAIPVMARFPPKLPFFQLGRRGPTICAQLIQKVLRLY